MTLRQKIDGVRVNPKIMVPHYESILESVSDLSEEETAELRLLLGRGYLLVGKFDRAVEQLDIALELLMDLRFLEGMFYCYINLGHAYRETGDFNAALNYFNRAYTLSYDMGDMEPILVSLGSLATAHGAMGNIELSTTYFERALEYKDRITDVRFLSNLYNNYANVWLSEKQYEKALTYFFLAYETFTKQTHVESDSHLVVIVVNIGETYFELGNWDEAFVYFNRALRLAEEYGIKVVEQDCHHFLAQLYEKQNNYQLAFEHYKLYDVIKDKYTNEKRQEELHRLSEELEVLSKRNAKEIDTLRNVELKSKTIQLEKTLKNLSLIGRIGQKLTASMDMDEIYTIFKDSIESLMVADLFGLALYDERDQTIVYKYFEENGKPIPLTTISVEEKRSIAAYCYRNEQDVLIRDFGADAHLYLDNEKYLGFGTKNKTTTQSIIYCRLITERGFVGVMTCQAYETNAYTESDFEVVRALASYVAIAISNAQKKDIIHQKAKELEFLSYNDSLTGVYNRRYFNHMLDLLRQSTASLGILIGDMNHLKLINDNYGHALGDKYLIHMAEILVSCSQNHQVFRLGGDEFAILLSGVTTKVLKDIEDCIRYACQTFAFETVPLSISIGTQMVNDQYPDILSAFAIAESKMYNEKNRYHRR